MSARTFWWFILACIGVGVVDRPHHPDTLIMSSIQHHVLYALEVCAAALGVQILQAEETDHTGWLYVCEADDATPYVIIRYDFQGQYVLCDVTTPDAHCGLRDVVRVEYTRLQQGIDTLCAYVRENRHDQEESPV